MEKAVRASARGSSLGPSRSSRLRAAFSDNPSKSDPVSPSFPCTLSRPKASPSSKSGWNSLPRSPILADSNRVSVSFHREPSQADNGLFHGGLLRFEFKTVGGPVRRPARPMRAAAGHVRRQRHRNRSAGQPRSLNQPGIFRGSSSCLCVMTLGYGTGGIARDATSHLSRQLHQLRSFGRRPGARRPRRHNRSGPL